MTLTIRRLTIDDLHIYVEHLSRHLPERGVNGIISQPFSQSEPIDKESFKSKIQKRWIITPGQGNWEVAWGLFSGTEIVGHIEVIGSSMPALSHRAKLGMGIETPYRSLGYGSKLLAEVINWSKAQAFLHWIDLDVFTHNEVALKLYKSFGFSEVGKTIDRLRVDGQSIDDYHLVLNLKN